MPKFITWTHDRKNTDGTPFTQAQFAGWELSAVGEWGESIIGVPAGWNDQGKYSFDLMLLPGFENGPFEVTITLRAVSAGGVKSDPSFPVTAMIPAPSRTPTAPVVSPIE